MESENKMFTVLLIALAAVAGGLGIVFSLGVVVQSASAPMAIYLRDISDGQKRIEAQMAKSGKTELTAIETRLAVLEAQVRDIKAQPARPESGQAVQAQPQQPQQPPAEDLNKVYDIPAGASYILGPKDAPVTITVFTDYQCPYCAHFYPAALEGQKAFADKASIVIKHFPLPFHPMARPAAKAALAAGEQGKFYEMSNLIFTNAAALSDDKFKELAGKAGLNVAKFTQDLKDKDAAFEKIITADMELASKVDVRGTPTYFLNGKKSVARTGDAWKTEIAALLKK